MSIFDHPVINTDVSEIHLDRRDWLIFSYRENSEVQLEHAQHAIREIKNRFGEKKRPVLVILKGIKSITKDARDYFASSEAEKVFKAVALVIDSHVSSLIANLYIHFSEAPCPTRLFASVEEAEQWLLGIGIPNLIQKEEQHHDKKPIFDVLNRFAKQDFSKKIEIDLLDEDSKALGVAINMMGEELEHALNQKKLYQELKIAQEQLNQASKLASLGTMASGVCHELNNPLTVLKGYLQFLTEPGCSNKESKLYFKKIETAIERMRKIVDHLRTFSRQNKRSDWKILDVSIPIQMACEMLSYQLKKQGVVLAVNLEPNVTIMGDSTLLESVFQNLISNSRDAFKLGKGSENKKIEISSRVVSSGYVQIVYQDNAAGMSKQIADKIFEPFFTTKEVGEGMGLGLSIAHGIVKQHGGEISVESIEGVGSKFLITLPRV